MKWSHAYFPGLRVLVITLLILGVFFRFVNLDRKVYWFDETYTSLRISGYTDAEVAPKVFDGEVMSIAELHQYQGANPNRGIGDTLKALTSSSEHPPLYYLLTRLWLEWFGNSVAATRSLSAIFSLLVFPSLYWLCLELFGLPVVGWVAVALMAVSPFHVLYAQEARQYSLWTAIILCSSAALLRAMRRNTWQSWGGYAATFALGLYTSLFTILVAFGHGLYVALRDRFPFSRRLVNYVLASFVGIVAFSPWLWVIVRGMSQMQATTTQMSSRESLPIFLFKALGRAGYVFIDVNPYSPGFDLTVGTVAQYGIGLLTVILAAYSLYYLCRRTEPRVWLFVLTLMGSTMLTLLLLDLILGGTRSSNNRYLIPYFLGIQLSVAYLMGTQITAGIQHWQHRFWQFGLGAITAMGILSCAISSQAQMWWNKGADYNTPYVAAIINQAEEPLVISDHRTNFPFNIVGGVMTLSYALDRDVKLQLVMEPNIPDVPEGFESVFLYNPSEALRQGLEAKNYEMEQLYKAQQPAPASLWKLEKK